MDNVEKNMLIGAVATGVVQMAFEGYWTYRNAIGKPIPANTFPYITVITPYLPPGDVWISCAGLPLALYGLGKGLKKDMLVQMSKGAGAYGVSELTGETIFRTAVYSQPSAKYVLAR